MVNKGAPKMMDVTQLTLRFRAYRLLAIVVPLLSVVVTACGTQSSLPVSPLQGVALIGSTAKIGLKAPVDQTRLSSELAVQLADNRGVTVTPMPSVRQIVGAGPHDEMMAFYARHGRFAPYQVQRLMAANLPASQVLAVRLESDSIERLPLVRHQAVNSEGMLMANREQRTYITRRVTQLSATLLNLRNGRVVWTRQYRVSPETVASSTHRTGESFSASVAAAVANTLVNGMDETRHPAPSPLMDSIYALVQEVVRNAPVR